MSSTAEFGMSGLPSKSTYCIETTDKYIEKIEKQEQNIIRIAIKTESVDEFLEKSSSVKTSEEILNETEKELEPETLNKCIEEGKKFETEAQYSRK